MKKTIVISLIALSAGIKAQIKIFPGGLQSYGSTTAPASGEKHRFSGSVVIGQSPSSSAAVYIRGNNTSSSASSPDYTWLGNDQTGIFHPGSNLIGFTIGGTEKWRIHSNGQLFSNLTSVAATPDYSWNGDANTGTYHPAADNMGFVTGGSERLRISNNGNILMGTSTDDNNQRCVIYGATDKTVLNLYGSHTFDYNYCLATNVNRVNTKAIAVGYNGSETFKVMGSGAVYAGGYYSISDRNLKENFDTISGALGKLLQLNGVTYNFKAQPLKPNAMAGTVLPSVAPKKEIGLIAQDVELIVPEAVETMDNGVKAVSYQTLVPLLIEAIKTQQKTISNLQNDVNNCCSKSTGGKNNRTINNSDGSSSNNESQSYLKQNKPNPFNKETVIEYNIVESGSASILVFDMNGKLLKTIPVKIPGQGTITINSNDLQPGMYYYSLIVNDKEVDTKKMILTQ